MPAHNAEIVEVFNRYATLLEIEGANPFRVRAYRKAARTIQDLPHSVASLLAEGADLSELPGIGKDLAAPGPETTRTWPRRRDPRTAAWRPSRPRNGCGFPV